MTTSRLPWSVCSHGRAASLFDANGNHIALFQDYRDAELVADAPSIHAQLQSLQEQVEDLTQQIKELSNR